MHGNYSRGLHGLRHCPHCMKEHQSTQKCEIACAYCHSFHLRSELVDGVCPRMVAFAQQSRPKNRLTCKGCQGEGMLEKSIETTFLELESKYDKRVALFKSDPENNGREPPARKVVRVQQKRQSYQCKECAGSGAINKVIYCCQYGCEKCNSQRCTVNPQWLRYKTEDYISICNGIFTCSQCRVRIKMGESYFNLPCAHLYHPSCFADNCWECQICEQAEAEKEKMKRFGLEVSDILPDDGELSDRDNLEEEITNLSFGGKRKSREHYLEMEKCEGRRLITPQELYQEMVKYVIPVSLDEL